MGGTVQIPALLGALLAAVASGSIQALVPAIIGDRSAAAQQGRALSVLFTVGDLGSALGPPLALGLLPLMSVGEVYRLSAGVMAAVLLFALWQSRVEQKASRISR
jgi:MFS family permease